MWCVLFWFFVNDSSQYGLNWHKTNVFSTSHSIILGERCCVKCWMTELSIISSFWCKIIVKRGNNSFKNDTIKLQYKQNVNLPIVISDHSIYCSKFPLLKVWGFAYKLFVMEGRHRQEDKYHMCKGLSVMYSTFFMTVVKIYVMVSVQPPLNYILLTCILYICPLLPFSHSCPSFLNTGTQA